MSSNINGNDRNHIDCSQNEKIGEPNVSKVEDELYGSKDAKKYIPKDDKIINRAVFRTHKGRSLSEIKIALKDHFHKPFFESALEETYSIQKEFSYTEEEYVTALIKAGKVSEKNKNFVDSPWLLTDGIEFN